MRPTRPITLPARIALLTVLLLAICIPLHAADEPVTKLKFSSFWPPTHPISKLNEEWCKEIETKTNGRVKITFFPGNTLTPPTQTYDSVVKGIADIGQSLMAYAAGRFPLSEVLTQPLGYTSGYQASKLATAYYNQFKPKEFDDTQVMYLHGHPPGLLLTRKPIASLEELKGLRMKVNAEISGVITMLGGAPVTLPITETYDALQKGILDGLLLTYESLKGFRFADLIKCAYESRAVAYTSGMFLVMNKEKWNSLPPDIQQTITAINAEYLEKQGRLWDTLDNEAKEFALGKGLSIVKSPPAEEAQTKEKMKSVLDAYVARMKEKGLPGQEALSFCLDYIQKNP